jgi:hypothetical protein
MKIFGGKKSLKAHYPWSAIIFAENEKALFLWIRVGCCVGTPPKYYAHNHSSSGSFHSVVVQDHYSQLRHTVYYIRRLHNNILHIPPTVCDSSSESKMQADMSASTHFESTIRVEE